MYDQIWFLIMRSYFVLFSLLLLLPSSFFLAFATVDDFTTDKTLYHTDDSLIISGNVVYDSSIFSIILQIITPSGSGLAHVDSITPKNDGTFSKTIHVGGPTWSENGKYVIKLSYGGNLEKSIDYEKIINSNIKSSNLDSSKPDLVEKSNSLDESLESDVTFTENPKMRILGFPSFDKSPQYYIDRYNNEPDYKSWFDSQFPFYTIDEVVGYSATHVPGFPSFDKSPQYYIDRYNNEPDYKSWFDSQFPEKTIFSVLGFSTYIPDWIKTYAQNWATGDISDQEFMAGLDFMLQNKIIVISNFNYDHSSINDIPSWFRNTAHWWSNGLISQQEFINSVKYLIQEDIILIE